MFDDAKRMLEELARLKKLPEKPLDGGSSWAVTLPIPNLPVRVAPLVVDEITGSTLADTFALVEKYEFRGAAIFFNPEDFKQGMDLKGREPGIGLSELVDQEPPLSLWGAYIHTTPDIERGTVFLIGESEDQPAILQPVKCK